jgi:GNAT superfamily N-acetyltransferase
MHELEVAGERFTIRRARRQDVAAIVRLLADDVLGAGRETAGDSAYEAAFDEIDADPHQYLAVINVAQGEIVGTFQLTLIPGLARGGSKRLQIEAVRLASSTRGGGLGAAMFAWAHDYGRQHGCALAQLTTDKERTDAHRFYERLGYTATHEGYKLPL